MNIRLRRLTVWGPAEPATAARTSRNNGVAGNRQLRDGSPWEYSGLTKTDRNCTLPSMRTRCRTLGASQSARVGGTTQWPSVLATTMTPLSANRSEEHTSELQSLMRISYDVFCLKKKNKHK